MRIRKEIVPFVVVAFLGGVVFFGILKTCGVPKEASIAVAAGLFAITLAYLLWFFRDPRRQAPSDTQVILAAADGVIAAVKTFEPEEFKTISMLAGLNPDDLGRLRTETVLRVSIFLSLFDVHVNRVPIGGESRFLGYFPGKHLFTFTEKSSDVNQHNSILISNERTLCLVNQIVGPVCRRVVYWLDPVKPTPVHAGDDFGMMKFGSRLDMYFPAKDIKLVVAEGEKVRAGESVIGRYR
ncbi:MAG: phosphatidylserine decarboxylase [Kiritimatiellia bacterium]